jgi:chromosome partitioning protein
MKVVVVANQKGGSGKSTTLVHLAAAAEHAGDGPAVIFDVDPQGTTSDWFNQRKKAGIETPRYTQLELASLESKVEALAKAGASYLFIDTSPTLPRPGEPNAAMLAIADIIIVPLNPTPADLRAVVKVLPFIQDSGKPFYFLLARVRANLRSNDGTAFALHSLGKLLPTWMHERVIYAEAFGHGRTAFETDPKGIAAREMQGIWSDVKDKLDSQNTAKPEKQKANQKVKLHG